jgi:hypothetical protein
LHHAITKNIQRFSGAAVKVWLELHTRFNGGNNGNVRLSMNEAVSALGIGRRTHKWRF